VAQLLSLLLVIQFQSEVRFGLQLSGLRLPVLVLLIQFVKVGENMKSSAIRLLSLSFLLLPLLALSAYADSVNLGTAGSYAVLAGSTVTNTGATVLFGDLGLSPGTATAVTGFLPGIVHGTINAGNAAAAQAQLDLTTAYNQAAGLQSTGALAGTVGTATLTSGVYTFSSSALLTGQLTLTGKPGDVFVFQIPSTLTTASGSSIIFINSLTGKPMNDPNIFWQVGSSATLGTSTAFEGNILALTSISLNTGATIKCGSALAQNGAVTLQGNTITSCASTVSAVPEPGTMGLLGTGLAILAGAVRRKMRI
jgi:Ice-binding-like/PEP-CTERM motif